jgi:hypothetical protein
VLFVMKSHNQMINSVDGSIGKSSLAAS